jgi:Tol biopolymer transport system component
MMPTDRFDRQLPVLLDELAQPRTPDYFDDLLGLTARTRQRPAWTLIERWLPMVDIARQPVLARQTPWRPIAVLTLILLLLAASLAILIGTRPHVPAPFGLARNGLVAFARDGDIYTADPLTGGARAVVTGPEIDLRPIWSRDGARFVFERRADGESGPGRLFVANADGTGLTMVTPERIVGIEGYAFSPDGHEILWTGPGQPEAMFIAKVDGSGIRALDTGLEASEPAWRPPDGAEILFRGGGSLGPDTGLYVFNVASGAVRTILEPSVGRYISGAKWSPDGSRIAYFEWMDSDDAVARTHIISADGTGDRVLATRPDATWERFRGWSSDGSRLISDRGYTGGFEDVRVVVRPVDGNNLGIEIDVPGVNTGECCSSWEWAPDDSAILGTPGVAPGQVMPQVMLDPLTGNSRAVPWTSDSDPAWQRLAP